MQSQIQSQHRKAFSLIEVLLTVIVIGIIAAIGMQAVGGIRSGAQETKLSSDVHSINQAIDVYRANGGSLEDVTAPQAILDKLKTRRESDSVATFSGLSMSMIDKRLVAELHTDEDPVAEKRAVWSASKHAFEIKTEGDGVKSFGLDEELAGVEYGEEARGNSAIDYSAGDGWVWTYTESGTAPAPAPTLVSVSAPTPTTPSPSTVVPLIAPTFSEPGLLRPLLDYPFDLTLDNPNSSGEIYYMINGVTSWTLYTGPIEIQPNYLVIAYVDSATPGFSDSPRVYERYTANGSPTAIADTLITDEDSPGSVDLLSNDSDLEGEVITVTAINGAPFVGSSVIPLSSGAQLTISSTGQISYDPQSAHQTLDDGEVASESFTYTITDASGGSSSASANVIITGLDDPIEDNAPVAPILVTQSSSLVFDGLEGVTDIDISDNPLIIVSAVASNGNVNFDPDGTIVYVPDPTAVVEDDGLSEGFDEVFNQVGNYTLSVDGAGAIGQGSYNIQVEKPLGATVAAAHLLVMGDVSSSTDPSTAPVSVGGIIPFLGSEESSVGGTLTGHSQFGEVTSDLAGMLNALPAGTSNIPVIELEDLEGVNLYVVWDDPNAAVTTTVIALGSQNTFNGASGSLNVNPIDTSSVDFQVTMGIGIGFSFNDSGDQQSDFNVNGLLISNEVGDYDDGDGSNSALWTIGGVGDSLLSASDELFDVSGAISDGDTEITWDSHTTTNHEFDWINSVYVQASGVIADEHGLQDTVTIVVENQDGDQITIHRRIIVTL